MSTQKQPLLLENMTTVEVESFLATEAPLFLPLGTLEAHGRHLPVGTDSLCAQKVAENLSLKFSGAVAPNLGYGLTNSLVQTSPGSYFPEKIYEDFVELIIQNLYNQGFKTIVVINGHGGNRPPLKNLGRRLVKKNPMALSIIHWWLLSEQFVTPVYNTSPGGHAAVEETAAILHFYPDLVKAKQYNSEQDSYVPNEGIWLYPPPGEVLLSKYGEGEPNFDKEKAEQFMNKVINELTERLQKWLTSIPRLQGGMRP